MKTKKKTSIFFSTMLSSVALCVSMLFLLYFFVNVVMESYYRKYQIKNVENTVKEIVDSFSTEEDESYIEDLAYSNNVCISVYNDFGEVNEYNNKMLGCELKSPEIRQKVFDFISSEDDSISEVLNNNIEDGYLYGVKNDSTDIFIYASLVQKNRFNILMKNQIIYLIIIMMIVSIAMAYFISKMLTKPIREITIKAEKLGKDNYDNNFKETGIKEIDTLSNTLDSVQDELGKVQTYQKELLANVTHDLKTPLTMIKAYAEKIKDISYKNKEKLDSDVEVIVSESDRLTNLVNDILTMTSLEGNSLLIEDYDLVIEINTILKKYDLIIEKEHYNLSINLPEKAIVKADRVKINNAIYNLINNAFNYTGDDKKITINLIKKNKEYLFEVIDTGKGIKEEDLDKIWTKYYKNDKNHKRDVISSGIGLSIVKEIFEKHEFKYGVDSKVNNGSRFYFYIKSGKNKKTDK